MNDKEILNYFETQAKSGEWDSLYNPKEASELSFYSKI